MSAVLVKQKYAVLVGGSVNYEREIDLLDQLDKNRTIFLIYSHQISKELVIA